jgi:hypothetical protein
LPSAEFASVRLAVIGTAYPAYIHKVFQNKSNKWLAVGMDSLDTSLNSSCDNRLHLAIGWSSLGAVVGYLQIAVTNFDILGLANGTVMNLSLLVSLFHPPLPNVTQRRYDYMKKVLPLRMRISRFLEERYFHRAQPHYLPELALFVVMVVVAVWPMFALPGLMETLK